MNLKRVLLKTLLLSSIVGCGYIYQFENIHAEELLPESGNVEMPLSHNAEILRGSGYYPTSQVREWLNSNEQPVDYTNVRYGGEASHEDLPGFLHEFTEDEINQIAVTRRRIPLHGQHNSTRDGGSRYIGELGWSGMNGRPTVHQMTRNGLRYWDVLVHKVLNDKVFILNTFEYQLYVQQRGMSGQKGTLRGYSNDVTWYYPTVRYAGQNGSGLFAGGRTHGTIQPRTSAGYVVPALHLKPESPAAQGLEVMDTVTFGRYRGDDITWTVINITEDGAPLLWSDTAVQNMHYSITMGDPENGNIRVYSEVVQHEEYDVDLVDDLQFNNPYHENNERPFVGIHNEDDYLSVRHEEGYFLELYAESPVGIEYIELPDGSRVYDDEADFYVEQNRNPGYFVWARGNNGIYHGADFPVGNIDSQPDIIIEQDTPPESGWYNSDVMVQIGMNNFNFNSYGQDREYDGFSQQFYNRSNNRALDYTSMLGKSVRVTDSIIVLDEGDYANFPNSEINIRFHQDRINTQGDNHGEFIQVRHISTMEAISYQELIDNNGRVDIDIEYTVPYSQLPSSFFMQVEHTRNHRNQGDDIPRFRLDNMNVEWIDDEDFGLDSVHLPNGETVYNPTDFVEDLLTESGNYHYRVIDGRGIETEQTIEVNIDTESPTLNTAIE